MPTPSEIALQVSDLEVTFIDSDGTLEVLDKLNFSIARNAFVCIVGPSGGGKSTLLRAVAGLIRPNGGKVLFSGVAESKAQTGLVFRSPICSPGGRSGRTSAFHWKLITALMQKLPD